MTEITHFHFEEIDLIPVRDDYRAGAYVDGFAVVSFARNGNWWIESVEIAHLRGWGNVLETRHFEAPDPVKSMVIRTLSEPEWFNQVTDHVCDVLASERVNEQQYERA